MMQQLQLFSGFKEATNAQTLVLENGNTFQVSFNKYGVEDGPFIETDVEGNVVRQGSYEDGQIKECYPTIDNDEPIILDF